MRLAAELIVLELRRDPLRLLRPAVTFTILAMLAITLTALVDTLDRRNTGVLRAVEADLVIFDSDASLQVLRSRIPRPATIGVGFVDGVLEVGVLSVVPTTVTHDGDQRRATLVGFNARTPAEPVEVLAGRVPTDGEPNVVAVDASLHRTGIDIGDRITLGGSLDVEVIGVIGEAMFLQQPTVWVPPEVWARTGARAFPERGYAEALVGIALVELKLDEDPDEVAAAIVTELAQEDLDVEVVAMRPAIAAVPGVSAIRATFGALVAAAVAIVALVTTGMALLQVDQQRPRDAELRAIGAPPALVTGALLLRMAVLWLASVLGGAGLTGLLAAAVPDGVPLALRWQVVAVVAALLAAAVAVGTLAAAVRVRRIDPIDALTGSW